MEKVLGIGGLFFRAKDPASLAQWYLNNLGINLVPTDFDTLPWTQEAGPTVFAPFPADTDYYPETQQCMVNFRVADLDAMKAQLEAAGTPVTISPDEMPIGRFARLHDPEGNAIELWEPT